MATGEIFCAQSEPGLFPNTLLFSRLVDLANHHRETRIAILKDFGRDVEANHADLLTDVLHLRKMVIQSLSAKALEALRNGSDIYICLVAPPGYEWLVGYLTIMSLGAAVVPIAPQVLSEEMQYFVETTGAAALLYSSIATDVTKFPTLPESCTLLAFPVWCGKRPSSHSAPFRLSKRSPDPMRIGYVIFTSGSTGPPKAVLHYYKAFVPLLLETIHKFQISTSDVGILHMPGHWMRGISGQIMFLLSGCRLEYAYGIWTPKWMWQQVLTGRVTCMLNGASDYRKLTDYYESHLRHLPPAQLVPYTVGLRSLRLPCIGGTPLAKSIWDAWNSIDGSQPLINDYGSTETFNLMTTFPADRSLPTNCVGEPWSGVEVKLSGGDSGEVLVRTHDMFAGYLHQPALTASTLDTEGFFRTGDSGYRQGSKYFLLGRTSVDVIRYNGWKIPAVEVEDAISELAYIDKVMVGPVSDALCGQRVGAIIWFHETRTNVSLAQLRSDLYRRGLFQYKLPTVLHRASDNAEFPRTQTGKPAKKAALQAYFPENYQSVFPAGVVEVWTEDDEKQQAFEPLPAAASSASKDGSRCGNRAWDWAGIA